MTEKRLRLKQTSSLTDRLETFAEQLKAKAAELGFGPDRDIILKRAGIADAASDNDWINSPGLKSPE